MTQPSDPVDTFQLLRARPDDPPNIKTLRWVVLGMGAILLLGFGAVVARIVYLTTRQAPTDSITQAAGVGQPAGGVAAELKLALPVGAKIVSQSIWANRLAVHYQAGGAEGIIILDLETGKSVSKVLIVTEGK